MSSLSRSLLGWCRHAAATTLLGAFAAAAAAVPSTQLRVGGRVHTSATYDLGSLSALPAVTQTVTFSGSGVPQTHEYSGAPIWDLLSTAGIVVNPQVKNDVLDKVVVATGTDGYRAVFSTGELSPDFGNRQALAAYAETLGGNVQPLGADGFTRATSPGDVRGGRYVSNLASLTVLDTGSTAVGTGGGVSSRFTVSGDVLRPGSFDLAALQALPAVSVTAGSNVFTGPSLWDVLDSTVGLREIFHAAPVPEQSTWLLWLAGLAVAVPLRRRWPDLGWAHGAG